MSIIYGLDIGTNSIGWSVLDLKNQKILGVGVKIFQAGVENLGDGSNELSKNAQRRGARGARKQIFRRKFRKKILLKLLQENNMVSVREKEMKDWFRLNPYALRYRGIREKISFIELGRVLYHMAQRRGFQSNSRSASVDIESKIFEGNPTEGKTGIEQTRNALAHNHTLGEYLYKILPKENTPFTPIAERVRNRYTTRQMYIDEFEKIWEEQQKYHSELTPQLKEAIGGRKKEEQYKKDGVLFFQRPLKSQKGLVGKCSLEPTKTRIPVSAIPYEKNRAWQFVNDIKCNGEFLNYEQRKQAFDFLITHFEPKFNRLRKEIGLADSFYQFNYDDDTKCPGSFTISNLASKKFFGKTWWNFTEKQQEEIWHILYFFDDKNKLKQYAKDRWNFDVEKAKKISEFNLKQGYGAHSRKAINDYLPFLEKGFLYDQAVALGGIKNAFGQGWNTLQEDKKQLIYDRLPRIIASKNEGGYINSLRDFLQENFNLIEQQLKKLYHHSANIDTENTLTQLPTGKEADREIMGLRNPVVITALFELRKLMNTLINTYGSPDEIKVELARDVKATRQERNRTKLKQRKEEALNDRVKEELVKLGQNDTHENILKYKLWLECQQTCPYTGRQISIEQLFSGEVQIEHIFPWSRSLDNSFTNKTLCFVDENRAKGDHTPYEYYSQFGNWNEVKQRALMLLKKSSDFPNAYRKFERFVAESFDEDFVSRQLNDTRYISREASNYLRKICSKVTVAPGALTSQLRHMWGLNNIIFEGRKERTDHRHHAIDAIVMACTKPRYLQELSNWNRYNRNYELKTFPQPWENFWQDTKVAVDQILVVHKPNRRVLTTRLVKTKKNRKTHINHSQAARGALHKETVYGKREQQNGKKTFHVRKPLESITSATHVEKIADPAIKKLIYEHLKKIGVNTEDKKFKIPSGAFFEKMSDGSLKPTIYLPNKHGAPVPVRKVRIKETLGNAEQLKDNINQHVNPRNNHHILVYKDENGQLKEDVVTFWQAVERKKQKQPVVQLPPDGKSIICTLQINDMFLLGLQEGQVDWNNPKLLNDYLFRVQKLSSKFYEFRAHKAATLEGKEWPDYVRIQSFGEGKTGWQTFNPIKIRISEHGMIEKY